MFLAVGTGAYVAAVFHMVTHAFFKALLFLGSGSVIHGMHDEQDMRRMGALRKAMPITAATFIVGWLAIAGIPPFAGFWSKDDILLNAWVSNKALWAIGFVTALMTAFYMSRQVFMVFFGEARWHDPLPAHETDDHAVGEQETSELELGAAHPEGHGHVEPHESSWLMLLPLVALAGLSIVGGGLNLPFSHGTHLLANWLEPVLELGGRSTEQVVDVPGATQVALAALTAVLCIVAILFAYRVYLQRKLAPEKIELDVFAHGWYYDEAISAFAGGPGRAAFDDAARFDKGIVDGAVNGVASLVRLGAGQGRKLQTGYVRNYALGIAVGAFVLIGLFLTRAV
jgi:NADH-quinone oxidoreductase subunit L